MREGGPSRHVVLDILRYEHWFFHWLPFGKIAKECFIIVPPISKSLETSCIFLYVLQKKFEQQKVLSFNEPFKS